MATTNITDAMSFEAYWIPKGERKARKKWAEGRIQVYRLPDGLTDAEYRHWWLPETDARGLVLRPARLRPQDKAHYLDGEYRNQVMNAGRTQVLTYIGSTTGSTTAWAQYFAIGTGAITATSPTDTTLANEVFRKAQTSYSVTGTQVDVNIQLGNTDAQVTMTNCGLYGNGATATLGSGSLLTHALFSYTKGNYAVAIDYIINLL